MEGSPYQVQLETAARREFLALASDVQAHLAEVIADLIKDPRPPGVKRLVGRHGYRIRKGNYRILFTVDEAAKTISIFRIGHRRDVYRRP